MFNANVDRPIGTGDWLIMYFHERPRLDVPRSYALTQGRSLIIWPPNARQSYSWNEKAGVEPHSVDACGRNFTLNTPLDELARMSRMSRSYLCHQFRKYFESSLTEYVIRKRMSAAQRLLYDMNLRPGEIAQMVAYPDIYQFSKQFKKSFGVSPSQYRRLQSTNG